MKDNNFDDVISVVSDFNVVWSVDLVLVTVALNSLRVLSRKVFNTLERDTS